MSHSSAHVQEPLQDRSRRTLEKILRVTEDLLATRAFDDISVADIVRRARSSVGSFYARFQSKDDLLPYLYERYDADLKPRMQARIASLTLNGLTLRQMVWLTADHTVDMYVERRHLLRAVALLARMRPSAIPPSMRAVRGSVTDMPARLLARFASEIAHDDAMDAARIGYFMLTAVAREKILFGEAPHASSTSLDTERLKKELARMLLGYLTTPNP
ncbi:MAG: TetR family transcriptional regulator [Gemmatimonadetes bacterium]|nr:TetR family transcriptional regulator [Gemmatimonadota bacterium]